MQHTPDAEAGEGETEHQESRQREPAARGGLCGDGCFGGGGGLERPNANVMIRAGHELAPLVFATAAANGELAVGRKGRGTAEAVVVAQLLDQFSVLEIPKARDAVPAGRQE